MQGFYEALLDKAQNIAVYLDEITIQEQFLKGIPHEMLMALIMDGGLSPEVNTVQEFVAKAQAYKSSVKTAAHYVGRSHHRIVKGRIVTHTQTDEVVCKEVVKGAMT